MHQRVKGVTKRKKGSSNFCMKGKDEAVLMKRERALIRREEYIDDLYNDNRGDIPQIRINMEGPSILEEEVAFVKR